MDSICGRELIDVSSALGSPIVVVMGGGLGRCTLTTPTDHTSPPPLKLLLYSMQSDKSNSEIGFENPNENHVQGEFSREIYASQEYVSWWFYCHQMLVLGSLQVKELAGALANWEREEGGTFTCLSIHLHLAI